MKKFLAMVMTVAMVISMMTVVSFAAEDIIHVGPKNVLTVAPGASVELPIYMYNENGSDVKTELQDWSYTISEDVDFSTVSVEYGLFSVDDTPIYDDTKEVYTYIDGSNTITSTDVLFTLKFTAPSEAGDYTIATIDDSWAYLGGYAADGKTIVQLDNVSWDPIVVKVAEETKVEGFGDIEVSGYAASVSYYYEATKGNHDLIIASYNEINGSLELDKVAITTFEAVGEGTANVALEGATGTVVKAFLWDANMNPVK